MKRLYFAVMASFVLASAPSARADQVGFSDVKTRFNKGASDRPLVDKDADLVLDDSSRKLTVRTPERPLEISYDAVQKVVFDESTHMRGGAMAALVGGIAGAAIASQRVKDYWCYLEYTAADGTVRPYMLEVSSESSSKVIEKMRALFGDRVSVADFNEKEAAIAKETLKDLQSKHDLRVDKKNRPVPESKPDKALVVVVCPPLAARFSGKGVQYKLHANDRVVAVNKMGTYSFVYLDPGEYLLVSQTENASGIRMNLEAGKEYYFLQDTFSGMWKSRTGLSRHTKELVMYELAGAHRSDWTRK